MEYTVAEIAKALSAEVLGDGSVPIRGVAEPAMAGPDDLALAMKPEFAAMLNAGQARAAVLWDGADYQSLGLKAAIIAPRPRYVLSGLTRQFEPGQGWAHEIHPSAVIDPSAQLGADVSIGPLAVIGPEAEIGDGTVIGPQCCIGWRARIGAGGFLRERVTIGRDVRIGQRFIAQPGAVIGGDGFSFVTPETSTVENVRKTLGSQGDAETQSWTRIHSLGSVTIGDDVEIGANTAIDRGTIRDTRIGNGTKFDNLVHIGHNVTIGDNCLICGQVGMAGSAEIGNNVVMAGQCGINDNISVGDNVILGGATKLLTSVPAGRVMLGYPAMQMDKQIESYKALRRLPRLMRDIAALKKAVFKEGGSD